MKSLSVIFYFLFIAQFVNGQALWSKSSQTTTANKFMAPDGSIMIQTSNSLNCLSPKNGDSKWSVNLAANDQIDFISPVLIALKKTNSVEIKSLETGMTLFNTDGKYLYASLSDIEGQKMIFANNSNATDVIYIDLNKNNFITKNITSSPNNLKNYYTKDSKNIYLFFTNGVALMNPIDQTIQFFSQIKNNSNVVNTSMNDLVGIYNVNKNIAILKNSNLLLIDLEGKKLNEIQLPNYTRLAVNEGNKLFISHDIDKKNYALSVYDLDEFKLLKSNTFEIKGISDFVYAKGMIYALFTNNIWGGTLKIIDPITLEVKDENPIKNNKNNFSSVIKTDNGLGLVNISKTSFLNLNNLTIEKEFPLITLADVPHLIEGNDVYYFQGGFIHKRNRFLRFDSTLNSSKIDFKTVENDNVRMEKVDNEFILSGNQSFAKVDKMGNVKYSKFYPAPGESTGKVLGNLVALAAASYLATDAQTNASKTRSTYQKQYWENERKAYEDAGGIFGQSVMKRYSKSFNDINTMTMVTKSANGGGFRIIKLNKANGEIVGEVAVDARQPDYLFDPFDSIIYLFSDNMIKAFKI